MLIKYAIQYVTFLCIVIMLLSNCSSIKGYRKGVTNQVSKTSIQLDAIRFKEKSETIEIINTQTNGQLLRSTGDKSWISYEIDVPVSGRYNVVLSGMYSGEKEAICWIEDYHDNIDGRQYNITGGMSFSGNHSSKLSFVQKDGVPLKAGLHRIKLHLDKDKTSIKKMMFFLAKAHLSSPKIFKQNTIGNEWVLKWSDEFDGTGLPDTTKWTFDYGDWGWGNNELQYYTDKKLQNARQENGSLIIEALKNDGKLPWSSARITTRGKESFLYGKIEIRAKVPSGRGTWSAGWLLGDNYIDELSWPYCGEIDVLENVGYEVDESSRKGKTHASVHCGAYYFKLGNQPTATAEVDNMVTDFHLYTLEWFPDKIVIAIDGKNYFEYSDTSTSKSWPFDKPQNIILNLAIGGGWGGAKGVDSQLISQKFIVDYVRVYELK